MIRTIFTMAALIVLCMPVGAQTNSDPDASYRKFPIIVSLHFHSLAMPFRDLGTNFSNLGFGLGTEVTINKNGSLIQQLTAVWYRNRAVGNGLMIYTQPGWRPRVVNRLYSEVKVGAGYLYSFRPGRSFKQENGNWISVGHQGKGMLVVPLGISLGYEFDPGQIQVCPFLSYQFVLVTNYNASIPLLPETLVQLGTRIHMK